MIESEFRVEPADYTIDFNDLRKVRETVFVVEQQVPVEEEWDELDPRCYHVIARDNGNQPIGTGRLTPEHKIGRMAVMKDWRGKGVGDALMRALVEEAQRRGWSDVSLNAQVQAQPFYARHGFEPYGERFMEAGIEHQAMRRSLPPPAALERPAATPRAAAEPIQSVEDLAAVAAASGQLIDTARREMWLYTRDLEHNLYGQPALVDALRRFGTSGHGGVVRILIQEPATAAGSGHPLLELAQRLPSVFLFRAPADPVDQQYAGAYLVNDRDGFLFRQLGSRWEGEWSPAQPARAKQLREQFMRVWERSRACSELRSLGI
ncbi:MAG TPA: GNAT family N-acetyltransferase [Arenimonas sp.]|nr:GNAT family N-acetyltransferase [Arenimonas sp.]